MESTCPGSHHLVTRFYTLQNSNSSADFFKPLSCGCEGVFLVDAKTQKALVYQNPLLGGLTDWTYGNYYHMPLLTPSRCCGCIWCDMNRMTPSLFAWSGMPRYEIAGRKPASYPTLFSAGIELRFGVPQCPRGVLSGSVLERPLQKGPTSHGKPHFGMHGWSSFWALLWCAEWRSWSNRIPHLVWRILFQRLPVDCVSIATGWQVGPEV